MTSVMTADLSRMFFVAAPFTLLVGVGVELFGPPPPKSFTDMTVPQMLWRLLVPSLLSAMAQLAITQMVLRPAEVPRQALSAAAAMFPIYVAAQLLASMPVGLGFLALFVPGLYLFARLIFPSGAVAMAERGSPVAILKRSWEVSEGQGLPLCLFLVLGLFSIVGISILAEGAGAALDVVARLIGLEAVAHFARAVLVGTGSCFIAIGTAVAGAVAYRLLARN
ncbi:hypothetical protein [Sandarakinorhabdus sp.]|uniref:hypothetical protein n=1 Tax=Sandarakinorhabdus sp. TaxID=1916663 RepID=UPI003F6EEA46